MKAKPRVFWWYIDAFDRPRGRVWEIWTGGRRVTATHVTCEVPTTSVFRGPRSRQPKAFVRGVGVVRQRGARIRIAAA